MKKRTQFLLFVILLQSLGMMGQDPIHQLKEVLLSDARLYHSTRETRLQVLSDSVIEQTPHSLSELLNYNSGLYFKTHGPGMVSSVSFRGTMASQTAVIWNGININSSFTGQTNFNTVMPMGYEEIAIRAGGGSVLYGSGAIGGSVHLNNKLNFNQGGQHRVQMSYGSFNTFFGNYQASYSNAKSSMQISLSRYSSDNDFIYPGTEKRNTNGDFRNNAINLSLGHFLNRKNALKFYSSLFLGDRGFSGTPSLVSRSKYQDMNSRNLLEWKGFYEEVTSTFRLAYLDETYRYYEDRNRKEHVFGKARTGIIKYELEYEIDPDMSLTGLLDVKHIDGEGSNIGSPVRTTGSAGFLFFHRLDRLSYEISSRKEFTREYGAPFLYALNAALAVSPGYTLSLNLSRNFRIPTFNDLFWYAGGNSALRPEMSLQAELGQVVRLGELELKFNAFIIDIEDLLRWIPGDSGLWEPVNSSSVRNYGLETLLNLKRDWGGHHLSLTGTYAYTRSRDKQLEKELIYVPRHKATVSGAYAIDRLHINYQWMYTGKVFTSTDNQYTLDAYQISDVSIAYSLPGDWVKLGLEVRNLWNENYQSVISRPMPGTSATIRLTFKL